jgi:hypothetical protein
MPNNPLLKLLSILFLMCIGTTLAACVIGDLATAIVAILGAIGIGALFVVAVLTEPEPFNERRSRR